MPHRPRCAGAMGLLHLDSMEAAAQRRAKLREAQARALSAAVDARLGAANPGAAHVHPVFWVPTPTDVILATAYFDEVARLAPRHGFGFVGQHAGVSQQIMAAGAGSRVSFVLPR